MINIGITAIKKEYRTDSGTLGYVSESNPAGLYSGSGTVFIPEIGFVSGMLPQNEFYGFGYGVFLSFSPSKTGVILEFENSREAMDIVVKYGGEVIY